MSDETYDVHEALLMAWAEHDDLIARAEAAERERDTLRALSIRVEDGGTIYNFDKALAAIPDGANIENITVKIDHNMELAPLKAHIAELEAQLAAQGWRPVTEPPEDDTIVEAIVRLWYREPHPLLDDEPIWFVDPVTEAMDIAPDYIYGWRPIDPPAPA